MNLLPAKPLNSNIEIQNEANQTTISWTNPRGSASRYFVVLFLLAWLGGWAVALYSVGGKIMDGDADPFLIFWLVGWSIGGLFAMKTVYMLARPSKPEKLSFDSLALNYRAGTAPFSGVSFGNEKSKNEDIIPALQAIKTKYTILKKELGEVKLERVGERQRLTLDYGAERIEIGAFLKEPEREWLFEVLKRWKTNP